VIGKAEIPDLVKSDALTRAVIPPDAAGAAEAPHYLGTTARTIGISQQRGPNRRMRGP
jgi:hypothetical protein